MAQKKNRFDPETWKKIRNSLALSLLSASGAFIASLSTLGEITPTTLKQSAIIALATGGSFIVNVIRKYIQGD